jgi:hypothetical protein
MLPRIILIALAAISVADCGPTPSELKLQRDIAEVNLARDRDIGCLDSLKQLQIGIRDEEVRRIMGPCKPDKVNLTVTGQSTYEQWVFRSKINGSGLFYLYFTGGRLESIQL